MKHYQFIDYATQGYLALVGLLVLGFGHGTTPSWAILAAAHAVGIILIHVLIRLHAAYPENRPIDFLRHFYPVLLYAGLYRETGALNHLFGPGFLDPFFIRLEAQLFGAQPSLVFMDRLPYLPVSEIAYAAYFSYYVMISVIGLALYFRDRRHFFHYLSVVSFVFYVCYLIYIFVPVIGPRVFFGDAADCPLPPVLIPVPPPSFPVAVTAGPFYQIMQLIYRLFEAPGAAFPSSHVAVAICTLVFSFRYLRRIRWAHLVVVVLLCLATVYCRYHYVVDVAAGVLTAAILIPLGQRLYTRFGDAGASAPAAPSCAALPGGIVRDLEGEAPAEPRPRSKFPQPGGRGAAEPES